MSPTLLIVLGILLPCSLSYRIVETSYGKLRGLTDWSHKGNEMYSFKGVPYAKPPIGKLRFALPETPEPWKDVLDAKTYSPACLSGNRTHSASEDCLYINIFTSQQCLTKKCPVIVYYHGGSFNRDSAVMFPDDFIKERYVAEGVVFVIPAFRLGVFGQLYFGPSNVLNENLFMYDAILALNYVHNEIHNFGGDPKQVTLMGHSSGASMVDLLGFSKTVDREMVLFQKMIMLSAPGMFGDYNWMVDGSYTLTRRLHCNRDGKRITRHSANHAEMLNCLRNLDAMTISHMQDEVSILGYDFSSVLPGPPFMEPGETIASLKKNAPPRKMIVGVSEHEFRNAPTHSLHALKNFMDFDNPADVYRHFEDLLQDHMEDWVNKDAAGVFLTALTYSEELVKAGGEVYLFETRQKPYSMHVTDMQYFIGIHREVYHRPDMDILDSFYSKMLVNFTKFDVPSPEWEKLDLERMNFLALEVDTKNHIGPKMVDGFHEKERKIWMTDMVEYDKMLTATRLASNKTYEEDDYEYFDIAPEVSRAIRDQPIYLEPVAPGSFGFYISLIFLAIVLFLLVRMFRGKPSSPEKQPLLV